MEHWRLIKDNTAYEVSNLGRIRNVRTGIIQKTWMRNNSALMVTLYNADTCKKKSYKVDRLVVSAFLDKHDVAIIHLNEDKTDCTLGNLFCCSHSEACEWQYGVPVLAIFENFHMRFLSISSAARLFEVTPSAVRYACEHDTYVRDNVRVRYDKNQ